MIRKARFVLVLAFAFLGATLGAQPPAGNAVRLTVKQSDGSPIAGALVALIDKDGAIVGEEITSAAGFRQMRVMSGTYRVRVKRIGYEPYFSDPIAVSKDIDLSVVVSDTRVALSTVVVTSKSECSLDAAKRRGVDVLWEEIAKALVGTSLSKGDFKNVSGAVLFNTRISKKGDTISSDTTRVPISGIRPFGAIDAKTLRAEGYVRGSVLRGWQYYAPDETSLLSADFGETHCFGVVRDKKRAGQVGLSFEPTPGRKASDVKGTLWLDEATSELREIVFRYVNIGDLGKFYSGGLVHFRRMPSGAWIVDEWRLRFPDLERLIGDREKEILQQTGFTENGGLVAQNIDGH